MLNIILLAVATHIEHCMDIDKARNETFSQNNDLQKLHSLSYRVTSLINYRSSKIFCIYSE